LQSSFHSSLQLASVFHDLHVIDARERVIASMYERICGTMSDIIVGEEGGTNSLLEVQGVSDNNVATRGL
jgi:hypothetical protein